MKLVFLSDVIAAVDSANGKCPPGCDADCGCKGRCDCKGQCGLVLNYPKQMTRKSY